VKLELAIRHAIANVLHEGLTDVFPRPFEVDFLKNPEFVKHLEGLIATSLNSNSLAGLKMHPIQHVIQPKKEPFDFRRCALIQPFDTIKYLSLVLRIADEIEKHRVPADKNIVFSYRFQPTKNYLFDLRYDFKAFQNEVTKQLKKRRSTVLVRCDIANFYDRLNLHRLESTLHGLQIDRTIVGLINELLHAYTVG
jgi:hypothetical protein